MCKRIFPSRSERLQEDIKSFHEKVDQLKTACLDQRLLEDVDTDGEGHSLQPILDVVNGLAEEAAAMQAEAKANTKFQGLFGQPAERYPELDEVVIDIGLKKGMWDARSEIFSVTESWKECLVMEMPLKEWDAQCQKWYKIAARAERELPANSVVPRLKDEAKVWKDLVPACGELKNPALQDRHWDKLEGLVGFKFERDPETWSEPFTLGSLMAKNIMNYRSVLIQCTQRGSLNMR